MSVLFPEPVVPTIPTTSPGSMVRLTFERTFLERSKEKLTFLNSILPSMRSGMFPLPKSCSGSASSMSRIFSALARVLRYVSLKFAKNVTGA